MGTGLDVLKQMLEDRAYATLKGLNVLEKNWKYTCWWYAGEGMTPAEDLFNTGDDPLELKNLADDPAHKADLERMREKYDAELALWKERAVNYNDYEKFGVLFDRSVKWEDKEKIAGQSSVRQREPKRRQD